MNQHLDQHRYPHLTVNRQTNFVDPMTGANTQTTECLWGHLKKIVQNMRGTTPAMLPHHLAELLWCFVNNGDTFLAMLRDARKAFM